MERAYLKNRQNVGGQTVRYIRAVSLAALAPGIVVILKQMNFMTCNCLPLRFLKVPCTSEKSDKQVTGLLCSFGRDRLPCHHKVRDTLTVLLLCQMEISGKVRAKAKASEGL